MTSNSKLSPLASSPASPWWLKTLLWLGLGASILILVMMIRQDWNHAVIASCLFYSLAVAFFFAAQLAGFVLSQTKYSDEIEAPKFVMLEVEERSWQK